MTSPNTKRCQNMENQRGTSVNNKPPVKRCTMQTKTIREIFDFLHDAVRNDHSVYGKASEQVKMAVLLSLFQPGVITRLKSADVRVDDPDYIDGSVITADFLLHIDFDKLLRYAKKLNDGLYPVLSTVSLLRPVRGTDVMYMTLMFKRNPVRHMFSKIGDMIGCMVGVDNKIYDIKNWSYDVTAVLCGVSEDEDSKNSLFALRFDDAMMRMNEKKLTDPYGTADHLFFRTGITIERMLYDTVNRRLNRVFERNGELTSKSNHEVVSAETVKGGCKIGDSDSIICRICIVFRKAKNVFIKWIKE